MPRILTIEGTVPAPGRLLLVARMKTFGDPGNKLAWEVMRQEFDMPTQSLVEDGLAPQRLLTDLEIGQNWTIPVYRPFPPGKRILEAAVEKHDDIFWDNDLVETKMIVYREAGAGINLMNEPVGRTWVRSDGTVLRQEAMLSATRLIFDRAPLPADDSRANLVSDEGFLQLIEEPQQ